MEQFVLLENTKRRTDIIFRAFSVNLMTATTGALAAYLPEICNLFGSRSSVDLADAPHSW